jgi:ribosome biogenesis GTPase
MLIDNPGMRELGVIAMTSGLEDSFSDILELSTHCRFGNCTHTGETGCAIRMAIKSGELSEERYGTYLKLMKESDYHEMSYVERRQRDKQFGLMVKTVKKRKKIDGKK